MDSQSRNPEGLWNLHHDRYSKLCEQCLINTLRFKQNFGQDL